MFYLPYWVYFLNVPANPVYYPTTSHSLSFYVITLSFSGIALSLPAFPCTVVPLLVIVLYFNTPFLHFFAALWWDFSCCPIIDEIFHAILKFLLLFFHPIWSICSPPLDFCSETFITKALSFLLLQLCLESICSLLFILVLLRSSSYWSELARLGGLSRLGEMIFIPRSYGIFYLCSMKKFVTSLEKDCLIRYFLQ